MKKENDSEKVRRFNHLAPFDPLLFWLNFYPNTVLSFQFLEGNFFFTFWMLQPMQSFIFRS